MVWGTATGARIIVCRPRAGPPSQLSDKVQRGVAVVAAQHRDRVAAQPLVEDLGVDPAEVDVPADVAAVRGQRRVADERIEDGGGVPTRGWRSGAAPKIPPRPPPPMANITPPSPWSVPCVPFSPTRRPN